MHKFTIHTKLVVFLPMRVRSGPLDLSLGQRGTAHQNTVSRWIDNPGLGLARM